MAIVFIPYVLRKYCDNKSIVEINASNLGELIENLEKLYDFERIYKKITKS